LLRASPAHGRRSQYRCSSTLVKHVLDNYEIPLEPTLLARAAGWADQTHSRWGATRRSAAWRRWMQGAGVKRRGSMLTTTEGGGTTSRRRTGRDDPVVAAVAIAPRASVGAGACRPPHATVGRQKGVGLGGAVMRARSSPRGKKIHVIAAADDGRRGERPWLVRSLRCH